MKTYKPAYMMRRYEEIIFLGSLVSTAKPSTKDLTLFLPIEMGEKKKKKKKKKKKTPHRQKGKCCYEA
jgi:hypothetical protein